MLECLLTEARKKTGERQRQRWKAVQFHNSCPTNITFVIREKRSRERAIAEFAKEREDGPRPSFSVPLPRTRLIFTEYYYSTAERDDIPEAERGKEREREYTRNFLDRDNE